MTENNLNRRLFLKSSGVIATGTAIAGCTDESNSTSSSEENPQEDAETSEPDEDTDEPEQEVDNSGSTEDQPELDHLHGITGQTYPSDTETSTSRRFEWSALGGEWWYELDILDSVIEYYENRYGQSRNYDMYVSDPYGDEYISNIAEEFERLGKKHELSRREIVNLAVSFVQSMKYTEDDVTSPFDQYTYFPVECLTERGGDCEDSVVLLAAILREFGYGCILLYMPDVEPEAHMALGVKGDSSVTGTYYTLNNTRYYYVETTGKTRGVGDMPDMDGSTNAEFIQIANHPTLVYEYETIVNNSGSINLNTTVWNYGINTPQQTSFLAEFEDRSGEYYSVVEADLGSVQNEGQEYNQLQMNPPDNLELRLNTGVTMNGKLHDINRSEWRTSPNS